MSDERVWELGDAIVDGDSGDATIDQGAGNLDTENKAPMGGYYMELPDVIGFDPKAPADLPVIENTQEG